MSKKTVLSQRYAWGMLLIAAAFYSYEFFLRVTPSLTTKDLMQTFNLNAQEVGMLSSYYFWAYTPMQLIVGVLMDHYQVRMLLTFSVLICTIGAYFFFLESSYFVAAIGRFFVGFGSAFAFVGVMKIAADWLPKERFALVSGLTTTLGMLGAVGGEFVLSELFELVGVQDSISLILIIGLILTFVTALCLRDHHQLAHQSFLYSELKMLGRALLKVANNRQIWINAAIGACLFTPTTFFAGQWAIPYLMDVRHLSQHHAAFISSLIFIGWAVGAPIFGWLTNRVNARKPFLVFGTSLATVCALILLYMPFDSMGLLMLLTFLIGLFSSSEILVFAIAHDITENHLTATAIALTNMVIMLGGFLQQTVGVLLDLSHKVSPVLSYTESDYQIALSLIPVCFILGWLLCIFLKETHCQSID
jgi:MFS family permease